MALFGQDAPDPRVAAGGAALGDLLLGGPGQRAQGAYTDQFKKNAQAADAMWAARDQRARAIAREGINPAVLEGAGYEAKIAPLLANVLATSASPDLRHLGDFADPADRLLDQQRREAMEAGDIPRYNRLTAVAGDKAYQPARVVAGNVLPDGVGLGDEAFAIQPLPQTLATIQQREAQAQATTDRAQAYADKQHAAPAARQSPLGKRAGTLEEDARIIEQEIGRPMTKAERARYLQTGKFVDTKDTGEPLGEAVPEPAAAPAAAAPRAVEARPGFVSFDDIPAEARAALKEGKVTKFANGQSWSLVRGKPVRVK